MIGIGYPAQFQVATLTIIIEGHCRAGLKDNLYMENGVFVKRNAEQVQRVVKIDRELGREIAIHDEAREILKLKGKDKVKLEEEFMSILITGGTGFLGSQLAHLLADRGEDIILFDIALNWNRITEIKDKIKVIQGNLGNWAEVANVVKEHRPEGIFHLGSMLTLPSQANPWASFQTNVCGTMHVLDAARLFDVEKVVFTSSFATYGLGLPQVITDDTLQRPTSMYGCGKLYCEVLGRFYITKFGLDFRSFRSPALVGPGVSTPGAVQFVPLMLEHAALGKPYECYVTENTHFPPPMYFKDSVRVLDMLYNAPRENIKTINYNVCGLKETKSAKELEDAIRKHIPEFPLTYKPDNDIVEYLTKYQAGQTYDDTNARAEWGWKPLYENLEAIIEDYIQEVRTRPRFFGINM